MKNKIIRLTNSLAVYRVKVSDIDGEYITGDFKVEKIVEDGRKPHDSETWVGHGGGFRWDEIKSLKVLAGRKNL